MSAITEIYMELDKASVRTTATGETYHVEALLCVFLCSFARCGVDTDLLPIVGCSFTDAFNGS